MPGCCSLDRIAHGHPCETRAGVSVLTAEQQAALQPVDGACVPSDDEPALQASAERVLTICACACVCVCVCAFLRAVLASPGSLASDEEGIFSRAAPAPGAEAAEESSGAVGVAQSRPQQLTTLRVAAEEDDEKIDDLVVGRILERVRCSRDAMDCLVCTRKR